MNLRLMRILGAVTLIVVGAVHLEQYFGSDYRGVPTIGPLFLLNAIGAGLVALGLLAPVARALPARRAGTAVGLLAATGALIGVGSLVALFISESGGLFGFSEDGYGTAIVIAIVAEVATVLLLAPVAVRSVAGGRPSLRESSRLRPAGH